MRPKIAFGLEYPLSLKGGVSVLAEELIKGLSTDYTITLLSPDTSETHLPKELDGHIFWNPEKVTRPSGRALATELRRRNVLLAHFHLGGVYGWSSRLPGLSPILRVSEAGIPCLTTVHSTPPVFHGYCGPDRPAWMRALFFPLAWCGKSWVLSHTDTEIAVSAHDVAALRMRFPLFSAKFSQIYHSRLDEHFDDSRTPREKTVLNVGHLAQRKGQMILVKAFALLAKEFPEWRLVLAGPDFEGTKAKIEAFASASGLENRVVYLGAIEDPFLLYRSAGIYVQPSLEEALGLALQEAMAYGCPSIGTRIGGIPELICPPETGLLVEPGDPEALAHTLRQLMSSREARERIGKKARTYIRSQGFSRQAMCSAYKVLFDKVLHSRQSQT